MTDAEVRERVARVEELLAAVEDDVPALAAVQAIVELYGEALRRVVAGAAPVEDELISHLLLVHGIHPVDVEERVARALDEVRPYLGSHGGGVTFLGVEEGVARVRLEGSCDGCASSTATLKSSIEQAVARAAPELRGVQAEEPAPKLLQIGRT